MKKVVGFSGGIDSQACARWVLNRFPAEDVILLNSTAGANEHPLTTAFVAEYSEKIHPVVVIEAIVADVNRPGPLKVAVERGISLDTPLSFGLLADLKGMFPASQSQFCTEILKLIPQRRWIREHLAEEDFERYTGVRREESRRRADTPFRAWDKYYDCYLNSPICDWTKQMCFDYVKQYDEPINPLYSLGFERVGCAPCVNSTKEDVRLWADRFPEMIDKVRRWEQQVGRTFWAPMVPGMSINWVDEVVAWSRTSRGGSQFNIFRSAGLEQPSCSSRFGLCE